MYYEAKATHTVPEKTRINGHKSGEHTPLVKGQVIKETEGEDWIFGVKSFFLSPHLTQYSKIYSAGLKVQAIKMKSYKSKKKQAINRINFTGKVDLTNNMQKACLLKIIEELFTPREV